MPKDGKRGSEYRERLEYQVQCRMDRKKFPTMDKARAAQQKAMEHFLETGRSIGGVKITARWRNPDNKNRKHSEWKTTEDSGQSLGAFWKTLHKTRGALRGLAGRYGL